MTQSKNERPLTVSEAIVSGSLAGAVEVGLNHPLMMIKIRLQNGDPFTFNPRILYRGTIADAASMIPITAIQVGLNRCFQQWFGTDLTYGQRIASAFFAGVGSSLVSCPVERVMIQQNRVGKAFYPTAQHVTQRGVRSLYTGLTMTAMREGKFSMFFLGAPMIRSMFQPYTGDNHGTSLLAGAVSGIAAAVVSQPFDTVKTAQQNAQPSTPVTIRTAVCSIYGNGNPMAFFRGLRARAPHVALAVTEMSLVNEQMEKYFR